MHDQTRTKHTNRCCTKETEKRYSNTRKHNQPKMYTVTQCAGGGNSACFTHCLNGVCLESIVCSLCDSQQQHNVFTFDCSVRAICKTADQTITQSNIWTFCTLFDLLNIYIYMFKLVLRDVFVASVFRPCAPYNRTAYQTIAYQTTIPKRTLSSLRGGYTQRALANGLAHLTAHGSRHSQNQAPQEDSMCRCADGKYVSLCARASVRVQSGRFKVSAALLTRMRVCLLVAWCTVRTV